MHENAHPNPDPISTQSTVIRHSLKKIPIGCPSPLEVRTLLRQIAAYHCDLPVRKKLPRFRRGSSRAQKLGGGGSIRLIRLTG